MGWAFPHGRCVWRFLRGEGSARASLARDCLMPTLAAFSSVDRSSLRDGAARPLVRYRPDGQHPE